MCNQIFSYLTVYIYTIKYIVYIYLTISHQFLFSNLINIYSAFMKMI